MLQSIFERLIFETQLGDRLCWLLERIGVQVCPGQRLDEQLKVKTLVLYRAGE